MYCAKCGKEMSDDNRFCPSCGNLIQQPYHQYTQFNYTPQPKPKTNALSLAGFITACVSLLINLWGTVGIVALVLSIIGYNKITGTTENGKGFAIAGIIIGSFSILYGLASIIFLDTVLSLLFS